MTVSNTLTVKIATLPNFYQNIMPLLQNNQRVYVSGHNGMVGRAVCRELARQRFTDVVTANRQDLDLTNQQSVFDFFSQAKPQAQIICAAVVGGITANHNFPADFIGQNLMMQTNLFEAAKRFGCAKTLFMGSSCIYPRLTRQPMSEEQLLTGALEPTNEWYAIAKLSGIKMGQAYQRQFGMAVTSLLPTNLYGMGDNFDLEHSHVIPGLMHRLHLAKISNADTVTVWGSGRVRREFLHVDDLAKATLFIMQTPAQDNLFNVGQGHDITIAELAEIIKNVVGYEGRLVFDASKPDGTPQKLLNSSRLLSLGWQPTIELKQGLADTYHWFTQNYNQGLRDSKDRFRPTL